MGNRNAQINGHAQKVLIDILFGAVTGEAKHHHLIDIAVDGAGLQSSIQVMRESSVVEIVHVGTRQLL